MSVNVGVAFLVMGGTAGILMSVKRPIILVVEMQTVVITSGTMNVDAFPDSLATGLSVMMLMSVNFLVICVTGTRCALTREGVMTASVKLDTKVMGFTVMM